MSGAGIRPARNRAFRVPRGAAAGATLAALLAASSVAGAVPPAVGDAVDPGRSGVDFTLKTRWGQTLDGRMPVIAGEVATLADGRRQVWLSLSARDVEIIDHRNYTRLTRGKGFFDAERWPRISFRSDPFDPALLRHGGALGGELGIRGVHRRETFEIAPAGCVRPLRDCEVQGGGAVRRGDYGLDRWSVALSEIVQLSLLIRIRDDE